MKALRIFTRVRFILTRFILTSFLLSKLILSSFILSSIASTSWGHQTSDSFLYLNTATAEGRLDIAVADLQRIVNLDSDADRQITWQELQDQQASLDAYVHPRLGISVAQLPCALSWQTPALTQHTAGNHLAFPFTVDCPNNAAWAIRYSILFDRDALHRGFLRWQHAAINGTDNINTDSIYTDSNGLAVLSPDAPQFTLPENASDGSIFADYFHQGVMHLLIGYDHILFLLALLLPVVAHLIITSAPAHATQTANLRSALLDTLGIVTLFTLAHSCTLALAAFGLVQLPATLVEIMIALSVSGAGVVALVPAWHQYRYLLAFGFGLVHGFGFANVLAELAPTLSHQIISLAAFNLGVEAGQALLISMVLPMVYFGRQALNKISWSVAGSAYGIIACGLVWAWQRI